jgi:hypothetical protein
MFSEMNLTDPSPKSMLQPPCEGPPMPSGPLMYGFLVNGRMVWRDGAPTGARPGRALRRQALQRERDAAVSP